VIGGRRRHYKTKIPIDFLERQKFKQQLAFEKLSMLVVTLIASIEHQHEG